MAVPARGVERWLSQRLSHRLGAGPMGGDGVCAGVRFLNPRSLVSMLLERERDDVWDPDRLVWPLLDVIDASMAEPWAATLARHLGVGHDGDEADLRRSRRWSVARRLAGIFASYAVQRPQLVADWREGRDTDGAGHPLDEDLHWQPELWRRLLGRVDQPAPDVRHRDTLARLRAADPDLELPDRLSLFGHTRLPVTEVELLGALGDRRDVHLWLPQPSPVLWDALRDLGGVVTRDEDDSALRARHPLLASLGRDTRELSRTLHGAVTESGPAPADVPVRETLLGWLQADLRANRAPDVALRAGRRLGPGDRTLQVHACHGASRQVDVLREVLVGLLDDDPTLEPRDILVMCPDIETYAPLIAAGFGLEGVAPRDGGFATSSGTMDGGHPAHRLRVRLADRALSSTNPLLAVATRLVELAGGRVTASEVLDLAGVDAVRRRFDLDDDDLARITDWVGEAGIRWGLDPDHRGRFEMQRFPHNTWRAGLDRLLLGAAMSGDDHGHVGRGLPVDDVGSGDLDLLGRLAELLHRLGHCLTALSHAGPLDEWVDALEAGVAGLAEVDPDHAWQASQFERELARTLEAAADDRVALRLSDVRALLESRLSGRPTRANFRTGTLTVCTMVPMRSVPHRVVCLVGLDDGVFPRVAAVDGDDALLRRPLTGERDPRSEDRQLLLDAVLAATETLVVTYTGANEHSGAIRPPAVPLGEILDAADRTADGPVRDQVLVRHPLQPYDPRNLLPGALVGDRPFSFDTAALDGAAAAASGRREPEPFLPGPLPPAPAGDVNLAELRDFFTHPVRTFLRARMDVGTPREADEVSDAIPVDLDALEQWDIGDRLLRELLAGQDPELVYRSELLSGRVPPGGLGGRTLRQITENAGPLYSRTAELRDGRPRSIDVDVDLGGRRLTGTVSGVFGSRLVTLGYSRLKPRQRLRAWIDLLALSVAMPDQHLTSHAVGRGKAGPHRALAGPLDHHALDWLRQLVELRDLGLTRPLPIPVQTACTFAESRAKELLGAAVDPVATANRSWQTDRNSSFGIPGEDADAHHVLVYGEGAPIERLLDDGLATYAWQVWEPLLTGAERVGPL